MNERHDRKFPRLASAALLLLLGQVACSEATGPQDVACDPLLLEYTAAIGDTVAIEVDTGNTEPSLVQYLDLEVGTGAALQLFRVARVHYTLYGTNNQLFQSTCTPGFGSAYIGIGPGGSIPGFYEGVVGMRENGVRRIIVPPELGYGNDTDAPNEIRGTIIFDVQLISIAG